jgi:hypothetical protein
MDEGIAPGSFTRGGSQTYRWCNKMSSGSPLILAASSCAIRHHFGTRQTGRVEAQDA